MLLLLWSWGLAWGSPWTGLGAGGDGSADSVPVPAPDLAEYHRLSVELEALVARNAWSGVERTFRELLATGVPLSRQDWMRGAESARQLGDVDEVYARLSSARDLEPQEASAAQWIAEIDRTYGTVFVACDPGSDLVLASEREPFDRDQARAIAFAQREVRDRCAFHGRLPAGTYQFYTHTIKVQPRVQSTYVDLRGTEIPRGSRRELRRAWVAQADASGAP